MEQIILAFAPVLVSLLTSGSKKLVGLVGLALSKPVLRLLVAGLSYLAALGTGAVNGSEVDPVSIQVLSETALTFLASSGIYFFTKKA